MAHEFTDANFKEKVIGSDKLTVIDFWAEWCGPCRAIAPLLAEVAKEMPDKVKIVKINVDTEQELAQKYGISSIPTLLFVKGGVVREEVVGAKPKKVLVDKINLYA